MDCIVCGNKIHEGRLKVLPNTKTCTECSNTSKKVAFRVIEGKTEYCKLQFIDEEKAKELQRHYDRNGYGLPNSMKNE